MSKSMWRRTKERGNCKSDTLHLTTKMSITQEKQDMKKKSAVSSLS